MKNVFEPISPHAGRTFSKRVFEPTSSGHVFTSSPGVSEVFENGGASRSRRSDVFEDVSPHTIDVSATRVPDIQGELSPHITHNQAEVLPECERTRCKICGNIVDAVVIERTAMIVKYKCTHPGCNALFSAKGSVAQAASIATTAIGVINAGIGAVKLFGGDISGLDDMFRHNDTGA